jgi:hypothetical protein
MNPSNFLFLIVRYTIKVYRLHDNDRVAAGQPKQVAYYVNGRYIQQRYIRYYSTILQIPDDVSYINEQVINTFCQFSGSSYRRKSIDARADMAAARLYLIERIAYLSCLN